MHPLSSRRIYFVSLLILCALMGGISASAKSAKLEEMAHTPLARFKFAGNGKDSLKKSPNAELENIKFVTNTIFLNGIYAGGNPAAYRAIIPIKGLAYDAFTFSLDFYPLDFNEKGVLAPKKRPPFYHSNIITGGTNFRWLGLDHHNGYLSLTLNDQSVIFRFPKTVLAIEQWHNLICSVDVRGHRIFLMVDGQLLDPIKLADDFVFNVVRSDQNTPDAKFSFTNHSNGGAFFGYVANLKVFGEAMTEAGVSELFAENQLECPRFKPGGAP